MEDEIICKICLEPDTCENMVTPCKCNGTSKYVHKNCLDHWRNSTDGNRDKCPDCDSNYIYTVVGNHESFIINVEHTKFTTIAFYASFTLFLSTIGTSFYITPAVMYNNNTISDNLFTIIINYTAEATFCHCILFNLYLIYIILNIKRKCEYFKHIFKFDIFFLFNPPIYLINYYITSDIYMYIFVNTFYSVLYLIIVSIYIEHHNKVIHLLSNENIIYKGEYEEI
jgi:hypothetical protein